LLLWWELGFSLSQGTTATTPTVTSTQHYDPHWGYVFYGYDSVLYGKSDVSSDEDPIPLLYHTGIMEGGLDWATPELLYYINTSKCYPPQAPCNRGPVSYYEFSSGSIGKFVMDQHSSAQLYAYEGDYLYWIEITSTDSLDQLADSPFRVHKWNRFTSEVIKTIDFDDDYGLGFYRPSKMAVHEGVLYLCLGNSRYITSLQVGRIDTNNKNISNYPVPVPPLNAAGDYCNTDVVIDPEEGLLFWIGSVYEDNKSTGALFRCTTNFTGKTKIFTSYNDWHFSSGIVGIVQTLSIDTVNKRLLIAFWADDVTSLVAMNYNGENIQTLDTNDQVIYMEFGLIPPNQTLLEADTDTN